MRTEPGSVIRRPGYALVNNQWGLSRLATGEVYEQAIGVSPDVEEAGRWYWNCRTLEPGVKGAPQIMVGQNPYSGLRTKGMLPRSLLELKTVTAGYEAEARGVGTWNLSFDIWLTESAEKPPGAKILAEVMVMLHMEGEWSFPAEKIGEITIPFEHSFDVRIGHWHSFPTYVLLPKISGIMSGVLPILTLLNRMPGKEFAMIRPRAFVSAVQLMTEIVSGHGLCRVPTFNVTVRP